jgi:hypothetical protein
MAFLTNEAPQQNFSVNPLKGLINKLRGRGSESPIFNPDPKGNADYYNFANNMNSAIDMFGEQESLMPMPIPALSNALEDWVFKMPKNHLFRKTVDNGPQVIEQEVKIAGKHPGIRKTETYVNEYGSPSLEYEDAWRYDVGNTFVNAGQMDARVMPKEKLVGYGGIDTMGGLGNVMDYPLGQKHSYRLADNIIGLDKLPELDRLRAQDIMKLPDNPGLLGYKMTKDFANNVKDYIDPSWGLNTTFATDNGMKHAQTVLKRLGLPETMVEGPIDMYKRGGGQVRDTDYIRNGVEREIDTNWLRYHGPDVYGNAGVSYSDGMRDSFINKFRGIDDMVGEYASLNENMSYDDLVKGKGSLPWGSMDRNNPELSRLIMLDGMVPQFLLDYLANRVRSVK